MTTKELIKLLQENDPDGNKEVVFCGEYYKEAIIGVEKFDDKEVQIYS